MDLYKYCKNLPHVLLILMTSILNNEVYMYKKNLIKDISTQKKSISNAVPSYLASKHETNGKRVKNKKKREEFTHHWKLATLKGHTGQIYNMSVSSNGKYVASCAEGSARHEHHDEKGKQSFQREKKTVSIRYKRKQQVHPVASSNLSVVVHQIPLKKGIRYIPTVTFQSHWTDFHPMCAQLEVLKPTMMEEHSSHRQEDDVLNIDVLNINSPNNNYESERLKIRETDSAIASMLLLHVLSRKDLYDYGYPTIVLDHVEIFHTPYPKITSASNDLDSGHGSSSSVEQSDQEQESLSDNAKGSDSDRSSDSEKSDERASRVRKICIRCQKDFYTYENSEYVYEEYCYYHWGKIRSYNGTNNKYWTCCNQNGVSAKPCATAKMHVWSGLVAGNNSYFDFVCTSPPTKRSSEGHDGVYGLDCEMCFTKNGLELTRVSLVDMYGRVIYDTLVKPQAEIIDYNSRFSGITEEDLRNVTKTLGDVQADLLRFVNSNTILIGHGLESDLRVLRLLHKKIIDTSIMFSHHHRNLNLPYRQSLKMMASKVLKRTIQESTHDSIEDSRAAMDLVMRQLQHDFSEYHNQEGNIVRKPSSQDKDISLEHEERRRIQGDFKEIVKMRAEK